MQKVRLQVNMINLMLGDCLERMKEIPDGSVDLIITSPPYFNARNTLAIQHTMSISIFMQSVINECYMKC